MSPEGKIQRRYRMWERDPPCWSRARALGNFPEVTTKPAHASGRSSHRQESRTPPVRDELGSQPAHGGRRAHPRAASQPPARSPWTVLTPLSLASDESACTSWQRDAVTRGCSCGHGNGTGRGLASCGRMWREADAPAEGEHDSAPVHRVVHPGSC